MQLFIVLFLRSIQFSSFLIDPSGFLVSDVENEKKFNFSLEQTLKEAAKRPLLLGLSIHVTENVRPDPTQMKGMCTYKMSYMYDLCVHICGCMYGFMCICVGK